MNQENKELRACVGSLQCREDAILVASKLCINIIEACTIKDDILMKRTFTKEEQNNIKGGDIYVFSEDVGVKYMIDGKIWSEKITVDGLWVSYELEKKFSRDENGNYSDSNQKYIDLCKSNKSFCKENKKGFYLYEIGRELLKKTTFTVKMYEKVYHVIGYENGNFLTKFIDYSKFDRPYFKDNGKKIELSEEMTKLVRYQYPKRKRYE